MVTCTITPCRAAVRLNSGVRRFYSENAAVKEQLVVLHPYDPRWADEYLRESAAISEALGESIVSIHHIGSTAIPGIQAKPVIDMLAVTNELAFLDERSDLLQSLGYEALGEFGISGRRYFRKNNSSGVRTHQIHAFQAGSPQIARHLAFRDYLIAQPAFARDYEVLKLRLAAAHPNDMKLYTAGKDSFIQEIDLRAGAWVSCGSA